MIVGAEKLTERLEKLIENIERDGEGELVEVDDVMIVAAVHYGKTEGVEGDVGALFYSCSSGRFHIQHGLLAQALNAVKDNLGGESISD